ncbi:alkaline phosphatase family protein [Mycobacterium celatum]|uniref:alkaline phosphatase family protein n=1 Tax=Mycobacterium celatum TaxID=28045 RepID=UPI000A15A344|nr:nucleotide pyrophosphatase/phosphodiesterase family protein [Mycobacterium celatum]
MPSLSRADPLRPAPPRLRSPRSICDILPAAAALLGAPDAVDTLGVTERIGDVRRVAVVLVDGMGGHLLPELAADAPLLASVLAGEVGRLDELACTFPSTTPTSLVSLGTGALPGEHGILGFTVKLPDSDRVLNHIFWRDDPPPDQWQPVPTWFERLGRAGVRARALLPAHFIGSGLTEAAYRGAEFHATTTREDYAGHLADLLAAEPGLVYGYTAELDTAAHVFGIGSPEWHVAAANVDALLTRLVEALPADAALLVTADHGGLNVPTAARFDLDADPQLGAGVRMVAGDPRVRYLHTVDGATPDVVAAWSEVLAGRAEVYSRDDAVVAGLFGPVRADHLQRIGDVVVSCTGDTAVLATGYEPPEVAQLVGMHGAATAAEMAIPLISFRG